MRKLTMGILAHVDAGKTTLSEALLYACGAIRKQGRVDKRDTFLDTDLQERERGITIFSKQAVISYEDMRITLLDTPGHVDFAGETERVLKVLDCAVLLVSGTEGVQGHTKTLFQLLKEYGIPTMIFVNKMDRPDTDSDALMKALKTELSEDCIDFTHERDESVEEELGSCSEEMMEYYLNGEKIPENAIKTSVIKREVFPVYFGSGLKNEGISELLAGIHSYFDVQNHLFSDDIKGAIVFKITHDISGTRLTHLKVTGGKWKPKDLLIYENEAGEQVEDKIQQIRCYQGDKYTCLDEADKGDICVFTGLKSTFAGEILGNIKNVDIAGIAPKLTPVLSYRILPPEGIDTNVMMQKLHILAQEDPLLGIYWDQDTGEVKAKVMGPVQLEVLQKLIRNRFDMNVIFTEGKILYKETVEDTVEGVGHYEPLRHYAEVHLLIEPLKPGEGIKITSDCSEDLLAKNWQRLVLTHLNEKEHRGVLTGAPITDVKITLINGRAHLKHTEGGDFRQATYRAVRQGLMKAKSRLLESFVDFSLTVPVYAVGKIMTELSLRGATFEISESAVETSTITGFGPVSTIGNFAQEIHSSTNGTGVIQTFFKGYYPCHNEDEVIAASQYDPVSDLRNPCSSVFCAHGAGFVVEWDRVEAYMHLQGLDFNLQERSEVITQRAGGKAKDIEFIEPEEVDRIIAGFAGANKRADKQNAGWQRNSLKGLKRSDDAYVYEEKKQNQKTKYLLVDGYNVIFAWDELKDIAQVSIDGARGRLLDILCNYRALIDAEIIVVFDAYRVEGHPQEALDYENIHLVYTKEAETADHYIERFAHENSRKYDVTVATSDGMEQIIILGAGANLISSRELENAIKNASNQNMEAFKNSEAFREKMITTVPIEDLPELPE